jgi:hypothetical protein
VFIVWSPDSSGELQKNEDDETNEGESLSEGNTEEHGGTHHAGSLWLTSHGLDGLTNEVADANAGANGSQAVSETSRNGFTEVDLVFLLFDLAREGRLGRLFEPGEPGWVSVPRGLGAIRGISARRASTNRCTPQRGS